jgi:hypothetical protein
MTTVAINNATRTVTISLVGTQGSPGSGGAADVLGGVDGGNFTDTYPAGTSTIDGGTF